MLWLLESGLVAIARLLLYLRLLGQVTNLFPQLTRRLSAGEPHARVRGPCAQFGGMGLEHVQQPLPVALVVPDALVVAKHALVDELERRLEQAERAEGEKPSPEQVKALALRMAEQRERAAEDPTQDMNRPEPSGDEPLDLSEPEDLGESGPFEERSAPRTKADLLREIRQRADRRTGQQEAEQRQIDPWQAQPPQRRGHGR